MQTTIVIDDKLLELARKAAAERGVSVTDLVEAALRSILHGPPPQATSSATASSASPTPVVLPLSSALGPPRDGVDVNNNAALRELESP